MCVCVNIGKVRKVNQYAGMHECVGGYTPVHPSAFVCVSACF